MNAKELIQRAKALFNVQPAVPAVVAPVAQDAPPAVPAAPAPVMYKTKDGQDISVIQAGADIAPGDSVAIAGAPAPAGVIELEDGRQITIGDGGIVSQVSEAAPVTQDLTQTPPPAAHAPVVNVLAQEIPKTKEDFEKLFIKCASGSPEERISNLELIAKALMENAFGWRIDEAQRRATEEAAINTYRETIKNQETQLNKHEQTIGLMFEAVEKLAETPTADPVTLTGQRKDSFRDKKEDRVARIADTLKNFKKEIKN